MVILTYGKVSLVNGRWRYMINPGIRIKLEPGGCSQSICYYA